MLPKPLYKQNNLRVLLHLEKYFPYSMLLLMILISHFFPFLHFSSYKTYVKTLETCGFYIL